MKHIMTTTMVAAFATFAFAATFEKIKFDTPILSEEDPLGVSAIQQAQSNISTIQETVSEVKDFVTNTISTTTIDGKKKSQLTGDVVVIGNVKAGNTDSIMKADTNSILFAVNRDMEDISIEDGTIKFDADAIKFPGVNGIWFGDSTLATILGNAGQGEVNTINTIKVNGSALTPDSDRAVDITIPAPGDANVIEGITVNGNSIAPNNKIVALTIPDAGQSNVIETVKVNGTALTPDADKAVDITIPSIDGKLDATNGVAFSDLKVYPMPSGIVGQTHTIITHESMSIGDVEYKEDGISYNGEDYEFSSDTNGVARLKDIPTISTNGVEIAPDASKNIDIAIPTVPDISGLATKQEVSELTITTEKVTDLDSYKNPTISAAALEAINGINNAQDIATIKSTLTNFLQQFVIAPAP